MSNSVWDCFYSPYSLLPLDLWIFYILCESYIKNYLIILIYFPYNWRNWTAFHPYTHSLYFFCELFSFQWGYMSFCRLYILILLVIWQIFFFLSVVYLLLVLWCVLFLLDAGFKFSRSEVCYSFMTSVFCDMLKGYLLTMRSPN